MAGKKLTKQEKSWILYDVANSAQVLLASTLIPIYFQSLADKTIVVAWGYTETDNFYMLCCINFSHHYLVSFRCF